MPKNPPAPTPEPSRAETVQRIVEVPIRKAQDVANRHPVYFAFVVGHVTASAQILALLLLARGA